MDKETAKAIIKQQLARRVSISGGPEVFRRMLRGHEAAADAAVADLVAEGILKETQLRVGKIYHYPLHAKPSLDYLTTQLQQMKEAPARPARPVRPAAVAHAGEAPAPPAAAGEPAAAAAAVPATSFTGPIRAQKKSALTSGRATPTAAAPVTPPAAAPAHYSGPVRAQKKSTMAAAEASGVSAPSAGAPADSAAAPAASAPAAPPVYTGPIRARKKSELAAEAAAAPPPDLSEGAEPAAREQSADARRHSPAEKQDSSPDG